MRILDKFAPLCCIVLCSIQLFLVASCASDNRLISEQMSPSKGYKVQLWEGDTGAVGTWMTAVKLVDTNPDFWQHLLHNESETIFGVDTRSTHVEVRWADDKRLEITCNDCGANQIQLQRTSWRTVSVSYQLQNGPATRKLGE